MAKKTRSAPLFLCSGNFLHLEAAILTLAPLHTNRSDARHPSVVLDELLGKDAVFARIFAELGGRFTVTILDPVNAGPQGPGVVGGALIRRSIQQLEVHQTLASMAQGGADAVGSRVTASDHDDILVLSRDVLAILELRIEKALGALEQKLHGEMNTLELASCNGQVAGLGGPAC